MADWGTVVLGVAGIAGTVGGVWFGARYQHAAWLRDRRAEAYVRFIEVLSQPTRRFTDDETAAYLAALLAFGSDEIRKLTERWVTLADKSGREEERMQLRLIAVMRQELQS